MRLLPAIATATALAAIAASSLLLGQDANWDLQNYHYYNPWAWVHDRTFGDLAAAQIQTFHNPLLDLPFYGMIAAAWDPRLIAIALAVPAAIAAFILCQLARLLFRDLPPLQRAAAVASSLVVGMTSAMGVGALSNTMNEWPLAALSLLALWLVVRDAARSRDGSIRVRTLLIAGVVVGVAAGAKLTAAPFAVGLCGALLCRGPYRAGIRRRWAEACWIALGTLAGVALAFGPWGYALWNQFGNPVFPYANQWFRSPWWEAKAVPMPHSFGPHSVAEWLAFPFELFHPRLFYVAEVTYRDARIPLACGLALLILVGTAVRRLRGGSPQITIGPPAAWGIVAWFAIVSFVTWAVQYAIYRYLLPIDALTGIFIAGLLCATFRPRVAGAVTVAAAFAVIATTQFANWGRIEFGEQWFEVAIPPVAPNALVIITTGEAVSYLLPLLPAETRYVALLNTAVDPGTETKLAAAVRNAVRDHKGPMYQLTYPLTEGSRVLQQHGLARNPADCAVIVTNMPTSPLELCRLLRVKPSL